MKKLILFTVLALLLSGCGQQETEEKKEYVRGSVVTEALIDQIREALAESQVFGPVPFQVSGNEQREIVCHVISDHHPFLIYDPQQDSAEISFTVTSVITTHEQGITEQRLLELVCDGISEGCTAKVTDHEKTRLWPVDEPQEEVSEQLAEKVREKRDSIDFKTVRDVADKALFEIRKITLNTQEYTYQDPVLYSCSTEGFIHEEEQPSSFFDRQWQMLLQQENRTLLTGWMAAAGKDPLEQLCMISDAYLCDDSGACTGSQGNQITVSKTIAEKATALYLKEDLRYQAEQLHLSADLSQKLEAGGILYDGISDPEVVILTEIEGNNRETVQPVLICRTGQEAVMTALIPCEDERFGMSENGNIVLLSELETLAEGTEVPFPVWKIKTENALMEEKEKK